MIDCYYLFYDIINIRVDAVVIGGWCNGWIIKL